MELLTSLGLSVLVISGSAALYAFAMRRATQDAGKAQVISQAQTVADDVAKTVRSSLGCDAFTFTGSGTFANARMLRCAMPEKMMDTDGVAGADSHVASAVTEGGTEAYIPGNHIFYIWLAAGLGGDSTKRLIKVSQASPDPAAISTTPSNWDTIFTFTSVADQTFRFNRLTDLQFAADSQGKSVLITAQGSGVGLNSTVGQAAGDERSLRRSTVQRRAGWINELDGREQGSGPNLLVNGDFAKAAYTNWTISGSTGSNALTTNFGLAENSFYSVQMNSGNTPANFTMTQTVAAAANDEYVLSFSYGFYGSASSTQFGALLVRVVDVGTGATLLHREIHDRSARSTNVDFWTEYSFPFRSIGTQIRIIFEDRTDSNSTLNCDPFLAKIALRRLK